MSFLYPLFLTAGAALAIPILIHLFNLRKYKTVMFPHTRFLKDIQLNSQKQSQVRYKALLAMRLLFLLFLILAFAQPFFNTSNATDKGNRTQIIYIDNSYSMSVKKGARTMLDIAKEDAARQVRTAAPGTRFILLTNDKPMSYRSEPADKVFAAINALDVTAGTKTIAQVVATAQSMVQNEATKGGDLFYYSDFQQNAFPATPDKAMMKNITFYGMPVQADEVQDIYIDTAYLAMPVLQTGKNNSLIVHTRLSGKEAKDAVVLQLSINGQVKSAATLNFKDKKESIDTLSFQVNNANWQQIQLTLNDVVMRFDDTFRITARSASNFSILVLNEGQANPYLQAAFRAYEGFRLNQLDVNNAPKEWNSYNLVILNGITRMDANLGKAVSDALSRGQSICIFPGKTNNFEAINEGLKQSGDIRINGIDTAVQAASSLQQGSALVKDLFEKIPDNVQLPVANWHYSISAGLNANQQSVLSFRNGDPLFARYTPGKGQLYICATSADLQSGNFPGSYFFAPFLYQMAMQSGSSNIYAVTSGSQQAIYLPINNVSERNTMHVLAKNVDVIPPQRPNGAGLDVFMDQAVQVPGFYQLAAAEGDTTDVALNQDKRESVLEYKNISTLKSEWKGDNIKWPDVTKGGSLKESAVSNFPLWKVCVLLAVLMLAVETWLLARVKKVAV
ncbi:vWA domain-containing protein [Flavipsychrobacter stenotrophus]|uniref:vWA domain-containing protein n=1 Tax=Flavipsychrobacter stenotrophus TaxID=2077091 RepID=UPI0013751763|nr:BatA and WFA domain-containing protein [Flavipsychrobacter stenotrophus]